MGRAEGYVENYLRDQCRKNGWLCFKFVSPGWRGVPDDIVIAKGYVIFVETKSKVGVPSEIQKKRIREMLEAGADVRICKTREEIDELVKEVQKKRRRH